MPFSLLRLTERIAPEPVYAVFRGTVNSAGQEFTFWFERGGEHNLKRVIGCAILAALPDEGVEEALNSLRGVFQFHYENLFLLTPPKAMPRRLLGTIVTTSERPDLVISE